MFKNATICRLQPTFNEDALLRADALAYRAFLPCGPTQEKSSGWIAPRGSEHGALVESIGGNLILKLQTETKSVPASVIDARTKLVIAQTEQSTGRKPGKKETREIKEGIKLDLLPKAFPKTTVTTVWICPLSQLLVIGSTSSSQVDEVLTSLAAGIGGFQASQLQTSTSPAVAMSDWLLSQEAPYDFTVDRECELKATDNSNAVVRYGNHALDIDEVQQHITGGKVPTRLAMTWDDRTSFVLTETGQLKKITLLESLLISDAEESADNRFDGDVVIFCSAMDYLIAALIDVLGGEVVQGEVLHD